MEKGMGCGSDRRRKRLFGDGTSGKLCLPDEEAAGGGVFAFSCKLSRAAHAVTAFQWSKG